MCVCLIVLFSFVTVTFVIEAMSVANAILWRRKVDRGRSYDFDSGDSAVLISASASGRRPQREERDPLIPPELSYHQPSENYTYISDFEIKERTEMVKKNFSLLKNILITTIKIPMIIKLMFFLV